VAEPAGAVGLAGATGPGGVADPVISTKTLWMDRIRRGYVGLIQRM
jgi:hypothetical protein